MKYLDLNGLTTFWKKAYQKIDDLKLDVLVSGTNIKTIDGISILGSGDVSLESIREQIERNTNDIDVNTDRLNIEGTQVITVDEMINFNPIANEGGSYLVGYLDKPSRYVVTKEVGGVPVNVGILEILSDSAQHVYTQVFTTHFSLDNSGNLELGAHVDTKLFTYFRSFSIDSPLIDSGTWTKWEDISHYNDIQKNIAENTKDIEFLNTNTGISEYHLFDEAKAYAVGDIVLYEGLLKKYTSAHEPGVWDVSQVESWSERKEVDGKIAELGEKIGKELTIVNYTENDYSGMIFNGTSYAKSSLGFNSIIIKVRDKQKINVSISKSIQSTFILDVAPEIGVAATPIREGRFDEYTSVGVTYVVFNIRTADGFPDVFKVVFNEYGLMSLPQKVNELKTITDGAINDLKTLEHYVEGVPERLTETESLLSEYRVPTNWYDKSKVSNGRIKLNGDLSTDENDIQYCHTDFIPVKEGDKILLYDASTKKPKFKRVVTAYDKNKVAIESLGTERTTSAYEVPANVAFVIVTFEDTNYEIPYLCISNDDIAYPYSEYFEPYLEYIDTKKFDRELVSLKHIGQSIEGKIMSDERYDEFTFGDIDKSYFIFINDDATSIGVLDAYNAFHNENEEISFAVIVDRLGNACGDGTIKDYLDLAVSEGGEIFAHYDASPTSESPYEDWFNATILPLYTLRDNGYNVRGIIVANNTEEHTVIGEKICRLHYDYSNGIGISAQFSFSRRLMTGMSKQQVLDAIELQSSSNGIYVWGFHGGSRSDESWITESALQDIIQFVKTKSNTEITTYNKVFDKFKTTKLEKRVKAIENRL